MNVAKLRVWNWFAGLLHLTQAIIMWFLVDSIVLDVVWRRFGAVIPEGMDPQDVQPEAIQGLQPTATEFMGWEIEVGLLLVAFLAMSAIAHLLISTVLFDSYIENLRAGKNPYRWIEYSVSASTMIVAIALLTGINDIGTLGAIFALTAVMNLMGWVMEEMNDVSGDGVLEMRDLNWRPFWIGSFAGVVPWVIILGSIWGTRQDFEAFPDFVVYVSIVTFVLFNIFAVNMWLQYKEVGPWSDYIFGEKMYIVLSLVAKSTLAWWVYTGAQGTELIAV